MADAVLIRNSEGVEYAVTPAAFEKGAETDYKGFRIVAWEDGGKYEGPKTAAALAKAQDAPKASEKAAAEKKD